MKLCSKCKQEKTYDGFYKDKTAKDGYNGICKACRLEMDRNRRKNDPNWVEKRKRQNSKYHEENRDSIRERKKKWFQSPKGIESHRNSAKKYKKKHPEKKKAQDAVYRAVKRGELFRPSHCQLCDKETNTEAHHSSYGNEKRTSVVWLCKLCHEHVTRKLKNGSN